MSRRSTCEVCGDQMEARRSTRRYCSVRCRVRAAREALNVTVPPTDSATEPVAPPPSPEPGPAPTREALSRLPRRIEVRVVLGERLSTGGPSGKGGNTAFVVDGRSFDTPREAIDFATR